jgi:hypothetical protein
MKLILPEGDFRHKNNHDFSKSLIIKLIKLQFYKTVSGRALNTIRKTLPKICISLEPHTLLKIESSAR